MRITGGVHRSRELRAPKGHKTRPTADRVREGLFSMLASRLHLEGTRVLDVFAGTGALGLEAISRGSSHAVFVENDREALAALRGNVTALGVGARCTLLGQRAERALVTLEGPFDVVFFDPPYALVREAAFVTLLLQGAHLRAPDGILVLEHDAKDAAPAIVGLCVLVSRRYGDTELTLYGDAPESQTITQ